MLPKSGSRLPKSHIVLSDAEFAGAISDALQNELGSSHRAAKTVIAWTGVSDRTARGWLNGRCCPSGRHLVLLVAHCHAVMAAVLRLSGHDKVALAIDLGSVESRLEELLETTRRLRMEGR